MSSVESIPIPSERIPPIANDSSSSSKTVGGVLMFVFVILTIAMISAIADPKDEKEAKNSAEAAGRTVGKFIALVLFPGIPGLIGYKAMRNASRATKAAAAAQREPTITWRLSGKLVIAADANGAPRPDMTFKVNAAGRRTLLALPRAEVIASPGFAGARSTPVGSAKSIDRST